MYNDKELYHFGVKGMKWGVRKDSRNHINTTKVNRKINQINGMQRYKDEVDVNKQYYKNNPKARKINNVMLGTFATGMTAVNVALGISTGGASLPMTALQAGVIGGLILQNTKYRKNIPKKIDKIINELDESGIKVHGKNITYELTDNGLYKGSKRSKRYGVDINNIPEKEQHNITRVYY